MICGFHVVRGRRVVAIRTRVVGGGEVVRPGQETREVRQRGRRREGRRGGQRNVTLGDGPAAVGAV